MDRAPPEPQAFTALPNYEILGVIASGGMGMVLRARHLLLNRPVAIKLPLPHMLTLPGDRERFLREARAAANLRHPHICPVHDVGEHEGRPFIAMGFVEGQTLRAWAKTHKPGARQAAQMVAAIARAVDYAHQHGIVHRDIKPGNVMVDAETGQPMLMDFGLAKELSTSADAVEATQSGQILGTPAYMAPEQAAGRIEQIGPLSDVYALGAVLFDLLCDRPPHLGTTGEILGKVQNDPVPSPRQFLPRLHRDLETICLKALALQPEDRYVSAAALAEDLERFEAGETILARRTPWPMQLARQVRKHPLVTAAVLALAAALTLAAFFADAAVSHQRTAHLARQFESSLATLEPVEAQVASIAALADELSVSTGESRAALHQRIDERLSQRLGEALGAPRLDEARIHALQQQIALVAGRAPALAEALVHALDQRRRQWEVVLDLDESKYHRDLLRREPATLNSRLEMVFKAGWQETNEVVSITLAAGEGAGYQFRLIPSLLARVGDYNSAQRPAFNQLPELNGFITIDVRGRGQHLRTFRIPAAAVPDGALTLVITREGLRLSCQINELPPLVVHDAFPAPVEGMMAADAGLPPGFAPVRVRLLRQNQPAEPSALEHGDVLFSSGAVAQALEFYQEQAQGAGAADVGQEARYKAGLCLMALQRPEAATQKLATLFLEEGTPWPALAGARLWLLHIQQRQHQQALAVFDAVTSHTPLPQLAEHLTQDVIEPLYVILGLTSDRFNLLHVPDPQQLKRLEQLVELKTALHDLTSTVGDTQLHIARTYQATGDDTRALRLIDTILDAPVIGMSSSTLVVICEDYGALMRARGEHKRALAKLEIVMVKMNAARMAMTHNLMIERARLHCAAGRWDQAQRDMQQYLALPADAASRAYYRSSAHLLLGVIQEERGHRDQALATWRAGFADVSQLLDDQVISDSGFSSANNLVNVIVLGSLTGELSERHIDRLVSRPMAKLLNPREPQTQSDRVARASFDDVAHSPLGGLIQQLRSHLDPVLRDLCSSERGRQFARDTALRPHNLTTRMRLAVHLLLHDLTASFCLEGAPDAQQDQVIGTFVEDLWTLYHSRRLGKRHLIAIVLCLQGMPRFMSYDLVAPAFEEHTRAITAYLVGQRLLRLGRPGDASAYFTEAAASAPADSPLQALLERALTGLAVTGPAPATPAQPR